ncbi:homocysteine-responsive endoplasmic reticulum-resident ubiquitin-like domain member 2 protein [Scleropages formosus]|uniref:homocysteine-responsive endoplasmic reticulum-resident ubiquitin-like domain member 2 protein n=1 Tax=Scleropages formosus TaxID=113540 RepID=UPI0008791A48|nr:homocysteine-responsive endoplasmic reticulum-resident ubiquitin-like domain member 2 protein [Scleropages formosus]
MDQSVVDSPVTLVIKAPNQKYDDQTINCFLNWTVEKLKTHLSKVYPSKPSSKDQRLVYSGRLLLDHLQLRDVLRKQDEYHMVHLVCASHTPPASPQPGSSIGPPGMPAPSTLNSDTSDASSPSEPPSQEGQVTATAAGGADGLRHRAGPTQNHVHSHNPAFTQGHPGNQVPVQHDLSGPFPVYPTYNPLQVLWWQQMYARHYYMQYQAAVAAAAASSQAATAQSPAPGPSAPPQPVRANEPPLEAHPPNPNIQMNAQGGAVLNDDELNRDWLDWVYTVSRAAILLSIVYFYSSFSRFVMVMGAMLLLYLHQAGWFPFRPEAEHQHPAGEANQDEVEAEIHHDIQEMERMMDEGLEDEDGDSGEESTEDPNSAAHPGFLSSAWSFITTFFTSLIPEGPPHAAN